MNRPSIPVQSDPDSLKKEHMLLKERVRELDRRMFLTPEEQLELIELKKWKLALKDEIERVSNLPAPPR